MTQKVHMKHFSLEEFDSPDVPGSGARMDPHFLNMLDAIRDDAGIPFVINSGFRTPERNKLDGGKPNSAHLKGFAADISAPDSLTMALIIITAVQHGIKRIGVGKHFVHLDIDSSLPTPRIWTY